MVSNEQEAQQVVIRHVGGFAWPTLLLLVSSAGIYVAAVAHLLTEPTFSWWALAGIAICTYAIYTPLHEAVHGAVIGMSLERRWINEWTGYVAAHFLGISFTAHRRSHLKHHRSTNHPSEDPDMVLSADNAFQLVLAWLKSVPKEWLFAAAFGHFTDAEKVIVRREFIAIILTLWAISPENQSNRLAPVIIDFGTEVEKEWGETNGDNKAATVLTEADKKNDPNEVPVDRPDLALRCFPGEVCGFLAEQVHITQNVVFIAPREIYDTGGALI